jgi:hypothetical protein
MKTTFWIALLAIISILSSCNDDAVYLSVDKETITVEAAAATQTIEVTASGAWSATTDASWVTISPTNGSGDGTISVQIAENPELISRIATITVSSAGVKAQTVTVSQAADVAFMEVSHDLPDPVPAEGGTYTLTVTSNVNWTAETLQTEWCTIEPVKGEDNGEITVTIAENATVRVRSASIIIKGSDGVPAQTISFTQASAEPCLKIDDNFPAKVAAAGSSDCVITVESNITWYVTSNQTWAEVYPPASAGNGRIEIYVYANTTINERTVIFTISGEEVETQTATLIQDGAEPYLTITDNFPDEVPVAGGSNYVISVESNTTWAISSNQTWATVSPTSGSNDDEIAVSVAANTTYNSRTAIFSVTADGVTTQTTTLKQAGKPLPVFAYSNIYLGSDGNPTFAAAPDDTKALYQGIYFKWGSLFGISPSDLTTTEPYIVFTPSEYTGAEPSTWIDVPFGLSASGDLSDYDAETGIGDICRYISAKGWVSGSWRMPTQTEYSTFIASGVGEVSGGDPMSGTNIDGTTAMTRYATVVGAEQLLPYAGYRNPYLERVNRLCYLWSASPSGSANAYSLYFNSVWNGAYGVVGHTGRTDAFSVRCVAE